MNVKAFISKAKLNNVPREVYAALVCALVLNCVAFPFTVLLNLLVMVAEKTKQRLRTNCNVVIAGLATTDLLVGVVDRRNNSDEFPESFWKGVREGVWWAVGYGDKSPKSSLARIYAASWMVISFILPSIFTAEVSSMLTETQMKSLQKLKNHLAGEDEKRRIEDYSCMSARKGADRDKQIVMALKHHIIGVEMEVKPACLSRADVTVHSLVESVRKKMKDFESEGQAAIMIYASGGLVARMFISGSVWDLTRLQDLWKNEESTVGGESHVKVGFETDKDPTENCVPRGEENDEP
ncbi:hypothetical protein AWC38_SpisGene16412 [Stylophora pistillata]|uniref:Uncharacterized protein n=1 Tax=Stylophora pistillata TaxID=50429 RepID=A0A2B4RL91_STYPI|nr:hypothetical protein AWC38_SpisGene16412 [Stylophora pistillata]